MNIKRGLKTIGLFAKDVLEVVSPVVVTGMLISSPSKYKPIYSYNDAVASIMNSSMWSEDKTKAVAALPVYANSGFYGAVISVVKSSMWSSDKLNTILEMSNQLEGSY